MKKPKMRLNFKQSKYLTNLFTVITASTIIIVTLLSLIFYFSAQHYIERALYKSFFDEFKRTEAVLESLTDDVRSHLTYLQQLEGAQMLINSSEITRSEERGALNAISAYRSSNAMIYSVYIYNSHLDRYYVIGSQNSVRNHSFFDSEITDIIKSSQAFDFSQSISRTIPSEEYSKEKNLNVFTYILPENYSLQSREKGYIIINVLAEDILKYIFNSSHDSETSMFFYDNQKDSVISSGDAPDYLRVGRKTAKRTGESGYFIYHGKADGKKYLVMYQMLNAPAWSVVNLTPYSTVSEQIDRFRATTLLILIIMLILSLMFCVYTSKTLYKPISNIFEKIQKITTDYSRRSFSDISDSIDALRDEMAHLNSFRQKNSYIIKNERLKNFIFNDSEGELPQLNSIKDNTETVALILIKTDDYIEFTEKYSYSDRMLYKYSFINIIEEIIGSFAACDFIDISDESITGIIQITAPLNEEAVRGLLKNIQSAISANFGITVSAFVSGVLSLPANLSEIYENLYGLSLYRFHYGKECIIFSDSFDENSFRSVPLSPEDIKSLSSEIRMHHYDSSIAQLHMIISDIRSLTYTAAKISVYHLFIEVFTALSSIEKNSNHSLEINYTTLFDRIANKIETLDEIENELVNLLDCAFNAINVRKANKVQLLISSVCDYVAENYSNPNLSTVMIADSIKLSARYLTKIFSENMAVSLPNYITAYRIEKSKELLLNTNLPIKEIVNKIGWINLKYFYTIFKKATGVTPGDFRASGGKSE